MLERISLTALLCLGLALTGCASTDSCCGDSCTDTCSPSAEAAAPSRLDGLEAEMAGVAQKRAWSGQYLNGGTCVNAWVCGTDLYLESRRGSESEIVAVDAKDGTYKWVASLGANPTREAPRAGDRFVVFLTANDGGMIVLDRNTGARPYSMRASLGVATAAPAVSSDTTVYVTGLASNQVVAVSPADANVGWRFRAGSPLVAGPVTTPRLPRRLVIAGCADGTVFAVPAAGWNESGPTNASWSRKLLGAVNEDPCVAEYTDGARKGVMVIVPASDNGLHGLEATSGTVRWSVRRESPFAGEPFACNGRVFARCSDRMVVADIATGKEPWSASDANAAPKGFELATKAFASDANRAYLGAGDNTVMRVDGRSGAVMATKTLSSFCCVIPGGDSNLLIGVTKDGHVVAMR